MIALERTSSNCKLQTHPLVRGGCYIGTMTVSVEFKKVLAVSFKGLVAKGN
jgi:hypothetical protein